MPVSADRFTRLAFPFGRPPPTAGRYASGVLDAARRRTDPLADAVVEELAGFGRRFPSPARAVRELAAEGNEACRTLVEQFDARPAWVDFERMRPGNEASLRHVIPAGLALLAGSLVESYANRRGVKVLVRTGRLERDTYRRLLETMQFVSNLGVHRGPRPGTGSYEEALGVRLMHAWVRRFVRADGGWDARAWGEPVNQEDELGTLVLFSHVYRRALELQGVRLTEAEHDGLHHCWRYTGYLLGIEEALLPTSCAEEEALYLAVAGRHYEPDDDSRRLTAKLLEVMAYKPPFFFPRGGLAALARRAAGERLADALGLPESAAWGRALAVRARANRGMQRARDRTPGVRTATTWMGERVVYATQRYGLSRPTEYAPPEQDAHAARRS